MNRSKKNIYIYILINGAIGVYTIGCIGLLNKTSALNHVSFSISKSAARKDLHGTIEGEVIHKNHIFNIKLIFANFCGGQT